MSLTAKGLPSNSVIAPARPDSEKDQSNRKPTQNYKTDSKDSGHDVTKVAVKKLQILNPKIMSGGSHSSSLGRFLVFCVGDVLLTVETKSEMKTCGGSLALSNRSAVHDFVAKWE